MSAILILGASCDSRFATKLLLAGQPVHSTKTLLRRGAVDDLAPSVLFRPVASRFDELGSRVSAAEARWPKPAG
jgi:hypothetical protein